MPDSPRGIRARRIEADNVVDGVQVVGEVSETRELVALAREVISGGIDVDDLCARNVVTGLQIIRDPSRATVTELRREVLALESRLLAIQPGPDAEVTAELAAARGDVATARAELEGAQPDAGVVLPRLRSAAELVTTVADTTEAAGRTVEGIATIATALAAVGAIAARVLGGS
jgi:hypothetical protein